MADMKHGKYIGERRLDSHRRSPFAGMMLVACLVMAALTASASGNEIAGDGRGTTADYEEVFMSVDKMPAFPGGEAALMIYLRDNITYPYKAEERNIQGKVVVQFVVDTTGQVGDVKVVRSIDPDLDLEAVRVVKTLPRFIPGTRLGKPVNVWYTLPVTFKLNNDISQLLSYIHEVDTISIDYCNLDISTPAPITRADFDAGIIRQPRDTVLVKRKWQIKNIINAMGNLAKLTEGQLDARGKITIYFKDGNKSVAYFDKSSLYYRGNYYDLSTFTAAGAEFRKLLFPLIHYPE